MKNYYIKKNDCIILTIYVKPNAKNTKIIGITAQGLNIALKAKPKEGEANKELIRFLSTILKIPQKQIDIISGVRNRQKRVKIPPFTQLTDIIL